MRAKSYVCNAAASTGKRGHKTGPGRGRHHNEAIEDGPPRLMNHAVGEGHKRSDASAEEHPMTRRLKHRQLRKLRNAVRNHAQGSEMGKVMGSLHPGKHRVGKVRSM